MSQEDVPGPRGAISFESRTIRIEAFAGEREAQDEMSWSVSAMNAGQVGDRGVGLLIGHLVVLQDGAWGQALVEGRVLRAQMFPSEPAFRRFIRKFGVGFIEEMYDVARRSLGVNAALLDCDFKLDRTSPLVRVDFLRGIDVVQEPLPVD